jgi:hypothetical protein
MSIANPLWGAPRIHGEFLKLGIDVSQTSVAKYMARRRGPPSQGWKTFLRNHADGIAAMDLFVVPTISFRLLYGLLIMGHGRRQILWFGVTAHPTAEWIANQLTQACGWVSVSETKSGWQVRPNRAMFRAIRRGSRRLRYLLTAASIRDKPDGDPVTNSIQRLAGRAFEDERGAGRRGHAFLEKRRHRFGLNRF